MIPKIVHYCWFGRNEKPNNVKKYIKSWKLKLPDYKFIEWNEDNFDINICTYTSEAYGAKKFAFVSDYARLHALKEHGGIYLDTDVEILKPFDVLLDKADLIFGFEEFERIATSTILAKRKCQIVEELIEEYHSRTFFIESGQDHTTNVEKVTTFMLNHGLKQSGNTQLLNVGSDDVLVLSKESFSPINYSNLVDNRTRDTFAVHHFEQSWSSGFGVIKKKVKNLLLFLIGLKNFKKLKKFL